MIWETMFWTVFALITAAEACMMGDQCDWTGSGLSYTSSQERGVTPVYLRCREGAVTWMYPRGALRLLFRPPLPGDERDFSVCVRVIRRDDPPDLFREVEIGAEDIEVKPQRFPARLFVESPHKLVPLYAPDDGDPRELRCFRSRKGRAALYVEAEPEEGPTKRTATLRYEARPLNRRHYDPATADCRPCSEAEMELAFCTSDLVSRGIIVGSENRLDLDSTQLTLRVTKLIRALGREEDPRDEKPQDDDEYYRYDTENRLDTTTHRNHRRRRKERSLHAHVHVASACGAAQGSGEFLVMARRRLGRYSLVCAPRIEDWIDLVKRRKADGSAYCVLQH
ncbi:meteorin-like protein isoform X2 [Plutella xylostella]|uniref:meteorin-like protein isoform X2 n=1 Tax=Plutella xylostella TaxID=51655 RepID=UPI0020329D8B|nr:meteorin-like protein isoform X2 [Plutella xylostella]